MDDRHYERYQTWKTEADRLCRVAAEPPAASRLPPDVDVAAIRKRLGQIMGGRGISQIEFAKRYGFSLSAVRAWEQGHRRPEVSARVLLLFIDRSPHMVDAAIKAAIDQAAGDRAGAESAEVEVVRPSTAPFEVKRLGRKRRGGVSA